MAEKTAEGAKLSLKLMVHKKEQRVIFAEADSDFVDTLFSIMTLPLGKIVRVLEKCPDEKVEAVGSLKNLYHGLMNLSENYFSASESKHMLLNPTSTSYDLCRNLKLNIDDTDQPLKYFICHGSWCTNQIKVPYFANCEFAKCPTCGNQMYFEIEGYAIGDRTRFDGFVTNVTTFIVTDDLQVIPNTPGFCIQLLCDSGITDTSQLEEKVFDIGRNQILSLLKSALLFKYPLTYMVFQNLYSSEILVKATLENVIQNSTSNEAGSCSKAMKLKVTSRKSNSKFLFAVVERDFVDFILGFLEIPLGTVIGKLLNGNSSLESLNNLFASISTMNVGYYKSRDLKNVLIQPQLAWNHVSQNYIFSLDVTNAPRICSRTLIGSKIKADLKYTNPRVCGGLVKALTKFMLTDDFVLTPVSSISTITELNKLKVPLNDIVEHEVSIGIEEGLKILKASLKSSSILTDALLTGNSWKFDNSSEPE